MWAAKDGNYHNITFSNTGRYLATIKKEKYDVNNNIIEIIDLFSTSETPESFSVKIGFNSPTYCCFSSLENSLLIGYKPHKGRATMRIMDLKTLYSDSWNFNQYDIAEDISSTIWSPNEAFVLVQFKNNNLVYLLSLKCSKLSIME
jgi:hypothetical protein